METKTAVLLQIICLSLLMTEANLRESVQNVCMAVSYTYAMRCDFKLMCHNSSEIIGDSLIKSLSQWHFADVQLLLERFPLDPVTSNYVREVRNALFSVIKPSALKTSTKLVIYSEDALQNILDMDSSIADDNAFLQIVTGNGILKGSTPLTHRYGGHQFGFWADQLGDGRAHMLGEYVNRFGDRWELQLKGSGLTPYSRRGDGRAVIRSSVREFLGSEAMHYLGIPSSRAATLIVSNDPVIRDQFYDGHPQTENAAVVLRLAKSWFRFGSFEILAHNKEYNLLKQLADFIIEQYFPAVDLEDSNKYLAFFSEVVRQTAKMIVHWQSVGFAHGVLNTDNFSILSITIDYGPFGFMDNYNPQMVPNTSDDEHRYAFEKQPDVGHYNLDKLRIALNPLLDNEQQRQAMYVLNGYSDIYKNMFMDVFREKLGIYGIEDDDEYIVALLLKTMEDKQVDFTMTFRQLGEWSIELMKDKLVDKNLWALKSLESHKWFENFANLYLERIYKAGISNQERQSRMLATNPRYILRNWIAQKAIDATEKGDNSIIIKVHEILKYPFLYQEDAELMGFADPTPKWALSLKVSCSS